jgi:hypothetical protein
MPGVFLAGLLAGGIHVVAGPDHLAAVAPYAIRGRRRAWLAGAKWGVGHTGGVAVIAGLALWLREYLPLERISAVSEQIVGVVLIGIGLWTLRIAFRNRLHVHSHEHDGRQHAHMHVHGRDDHESPAAHEHSHAPFWVGILHGAAGSAHFLGVLPALALPTRAEAASYLTGYGAGTVLSMIAFAGILGTISAGAGARSGSLYKAILSGAGVAAVAVGAFWLVP